MTSLLEPLSLHHGKLISMAIVLPACILGIPSIAADPESNKVEAIINTTLKKHDEPGGAVPQLCVRIKDAWLELRDKRQAGDQEINMTAAEHHLFMRLVTCVTGDPLAVNAPYLYETKKRLFTFLGLEKTMQVTDQPISPANAEVTKWGERGAQRGLQDYTKVTGKPANNNGASLKAFTHEAYRTGPG